MKRLQVRFDSELYDALARRAAEEGTTKAALIRRFLTEGVRESASGKRKR